MTIAFLACVEQGNLENQTRMLCHSIRKFGGSLSGAAIHTFRPRGGPKLSSSTLAELRSLRVIHHDQALNTEYAYYGVGNKIFVSAWAEEHLEEEFLVFLDSDTLLLNEPSEWLLSEDVDAAACPGVRWEGGIASRGPEDPKDVYWKAAYDICGVKEEPFVTSVVDQQQIRAYFNGGLIVSRREAGIFRSWRANFTTLMKRGHYPPDKNRGINNMDEIALGISLAKSFERLKILDERYNYPLHRRSELQGSARFAELEDLIHLHYHGWFNRPGYLDSLNPGFNPDSPLLSWIQSFLPFAPYI